MREFTEDDLDHIEDVIIRVGSNRVKAPPNVVAAMRNRLKWALRNEALLEYYQRTYGPPRPRPHDDTALLQAANRAHAFFSKLIKRR